MKLYFYHTLPVIQQYQEWQNQKLPGHVLYGLTHFDKHGIESVLHDYKKEKNRLEFMVRNWWKIITCKESFDVLYGTSFRGLEILVFLRALGLYRKPIVVWHHTSVTTSSKKLVNLISTFFYKGFDELFFFNTKLIDYSVQTGKIKREHAHLIHWGPDLDYYDRLKSEVHEQNSFFISTGRENRDFLTLVKAFEGESASIELFVPKINIKNGYRELLGDPNQFPNNIKLEYVTGLLTDELARRVAAAAIVAICFQKPPYAYTLGLTTLVEAFALGKPVLSSINPYWETDIDAEGIGISLPYGDAEAWRKAIRYLSANPDKAIAMGQKARKLAETSFNLEIFTKELAEILNKL
ncbi:MAG TPA: glycosyltransferase family 1 protein [Bacteroidales bacterium]|nr:glycosyltransferase family 1 protein [Bacteroidales bacterium]